MMGCCFGPGAVNGKKWMIEHPVPPSDKKPVLAWQPSFAGMAASGDMGFTTGPWEAKADIKDEKPSGVGHFVTVWKKQADGSWKFVVDLGISIRSQVDHKRCGSQLTRTRRKSFKPVDVAAASLSSNVIRPMKLRMKQGLAKRLPLTLRLKSDSIAPAIFRSSADMHAAEAWQNDRSG